MDGAMSASSGALARQVPPPTSPASPRSPVTVSGMAISAWGTGSSITTRGPASGAFTSQLTRGASRWGSSAARAGIQRI
jgi:hypothetical protein